MVKGFVKEAAVGLAGGAVLFGILIGCMDARADMLGITDQTEQIVTLAAEAANVEPNERLWEICLEHKTAERTSTAAPEHEPGEGPTAEVLQESSEVSESAAHMQRLYDVPLDDALQLYITETAVRYGMSPELVLSVIWRESRYDGSAIGDAGEAIGLMQIQPQWHGERMEKLGVTDLADPYSNILVGVDLLAELIGEYGLYGGLSYYRYGTAVGAAEYVAEVLEYMESIERR